MLSAAIISLIRLPNGAVEFPLGPTYKDLYIGPKPVFASISAYLAFSFRSLTKHAIPSNNTVSTATIPKSAVNTLLNKSFAKLENGPTHPCRLAATSAFVHTLSVMKGGVVAFVYPQQLKRCWRRDCVSVVWLPQTWARLARVLRVWNQIERPRTRVKTAQRTTR
jgi:hypothetical protein